MSKLSEILQQARGGDAKAQCLAGWAYDSGKGTRKSFREAAAWYEKAAKQGDATAQYNLSLLYLLGRGVKKDVTKSLKWNRAAAKSGDADAELAMGWFYHGGRGIKTDLKKAKRWYLKAAKKGELSAMFSLGQIAFDKGDFRTAARWFLKAAQYDHPRSNYYLGKMFLKGKGVSADPFRARTSLKVAARYDIGHAGRLLKSRKLKKLLNRGSDVMVNSWQRGAPLPPSERHI